ncbi:unnamed protein product [Cuscuta campestris]|uniref:Cyclin N-terminal domain-containing protein n=1 Tax=Cuscuta campestris TaxID=132261 RepID=A0A484L4P9_9ASTE|nr:unnamed protein product [Cuscuta campestris]
MAEISIFTTVTGAWSSVHLDWRPKRTAESTTPEVIRRLKFWNRTAGRETKPVVRGWSTDVTWDDDYDSQGRRWSSDWTAGSSVVVTPVLPPPSREDFEESVRNLVCKERNHMPQPGYVEYLESNPLVYNARFNAISWMIECRRRLNISLESVFCAANYIDRFISTRNCKGWECRTFDLLAKACLYVASKFNDTDPPSLHAILQVYP